jgi:hypothetical protein
VTDFSSEKGIAAVSSWIQYLPDMRKHRKTPHYYGCDLHVARRFQSSKCATHFAHLDF